MSNIVLQAGRSKQSVPGFVCTPLCLDETREDKRNDRRKQGPGREYASISVLPSCPVFIRDSNPVAERKQTKVCPPLVCHHRRRNARRLERHQQWPPRQHTPHAIPIRPRATLPAGSPPRHSTPLHRKPSPSIPSPPTNIPLPALFLFPRLKPPRPPPPENAGTRFRPLPRLLYVESRQADSSSLAARRSFVLPRSMCHPGLPPLPPGCTVIRRRDRQAGVVASPPAAALARHVLAQPHYHCVCSPTAHRGSFRCRWHRSSYQWGRRQP
jgi:hypothetical protein